MMKTLQSIALLAFALCAVTMAAPASQAQDLKQLNLTDKQVEAFIAAQKDFQPLAGKLLEGGDKPNDSLLGELETISKKHGFASFSEFEDVGANITLVLDGLDRKTGSYTDPIEKMKTELEDIKKDTSIPDEDKKLAVDDLTQEIAAAQPLQFKNNIDIVKKYQGDLEKLIVESTGDSPPAPADAAPAPDAKPAEAAPAPAPEAKPAEASPAPAPEEKK